MKIGDRIKTTFSNGYTGTVMQLRNTDTCLVKRDDGKASTNGLWISSYDNIVKVEPEPKRTKLETAIRQCIIHLKGETL